MANNTHMEYSGCLLMVVPLDEDCAIVEAVPSFVTTGFVEINNEWEEEDGTDYGQANAAGQACGPELVGPTRRKWLNMSGQLCLIDWAMLSALTGNPTTTDGADGNVIGYTDLVSSAAEPCAPAGASGPRNALAVVTRSAAGDAGGGPCAGLGNETGLSNCKAHIYPLVTEFTHSPPNHLDERRTIEFEAKAYPNPNMGAGGPFNLYPTATATPTSIADAGAHWEGFVDCAGLPAPSVSDTVDHPTPTPEGGVT